MSGARDDKEGGRDDGEVGGAREDEEVAGLVMRKKLVFASERSERGNLFEGVTASGYILLVRAK